MIPDCVEALISDTGNNPFVVNDSDLDLFSDDNFDFFVKTKGPGSPEGGNPLRRSSHRRSSVLSDASSVGSDEASFVSMEFASMEFSVSSKKSRRSLGRGSCHSEDKGMSKSRKNTPPKRKVGFHARIAIRKIPHFRDITDAELASRWYQEKEIAEIKSQAAQVIERADASETLQGECLRGLKISSEKQPRKSNWIMALSCVLDEQKRQMTHGQRDPEKLAKLYKSFSFGAEQKAIAKGKSDAQAAKNTTQHHSAHSLLENKLL